MFFLASVCNHVVIANVLISWTGVHWARGGGVGGWGSGCGVRFSFDKKEKKKKRKKKYLI